MPCFTKDLTNLKVVNQYYQDIIDCMPNIIYILDKDCALTGCNTNFLKLIGLKELTKGSVNPYKQLIKQAHWPEERVEAIKRDDINAVLMGETILNVEGAPIINRHGKISYFEFSRIPLFDLTKNVIGLVVILTDISGRKKMEEQLVRLKEQLQQNNIKSSSSMSQPLNGEKIPKVLMVEDNSVAQKSTQALLMQLDCHVDVAKSGDEAAKLFEPGKYDLIFMDIGLEDTSGYVVSKKIRQMEKGTEYHVPILALTGFEADVVKYDCDEFYMEGALTKPLTSEQAKQIIQHYVYNIDIPIRGLKSIKS